MTLPTTTTLASRFPLVARQRPAAKPLDTRVTRLAALANDAVRDRAPDIASMVFNGAALLASDCGDAALARTWCLRHARLYLDQAPLDGYTSRFALEPVVNLARLRNRTGDHDDAYDLLNNLHRAIYARVPVTLDGLEILPEHLPTEPNQRDQITSWLNDVMLSDATRALTLAGRWSAALRHIRRYDGIGPTLREGRQVAVIALTMQGNPATAAALLKEATIERRSEQVVKDLLRSWHAQTVGVDHPANQQRLILQASAIPPTPGLTVFRTRLCLTAIDLIPNLPSDAIKSTISRLTTDVLREEDGNAAYELRQHRAAEQQAATGLEHLVDLSGVGVGQIPEAVRDQLSTALNLAESVITRRSRPVSASGL